MQSIRRGPPKTSRAEIQQALVEILAESLCIDGGVLSAETDLFQDLGIESIELVNIVATLEERMGIALDVRQLLTLRTLGEVTEYVIELKRSGS